MSRRDDFLEAENLPDAALTPQEGLEPISGRATPLEMRAQRLEQDAQRLAAEHQFEAAIAAYTAALELMPDSAPIWRDRALALQALGRDEDAVASYDRSLELQPDWAIAWHHRGVSLERLDRGAEALASYDEAIRLKPDYAPAWQNRGRLLYRLSTAQLDPTSLVPLPESMAGRSDQIVRADQIRADQIDNADQAGSADQWAQKAIDLRHQHRYQDAIASYDQALALKPSSYALWHQRGLVQRRLGHFESAIADFDQALALNPDFYPATRSRLYALLTTGQLISHVLGNCTLAERQRLWTDLRNALEVLIKQKMPTLVIIGITALLSTHSQGAAVGIAAIFLVITLWSDVIREAEK